MTLKNILLFLALTANTAMAQTFDPPDSRPPTESLEEIETLGPQTADPTPIPTNPMPNMPMMNPFPSSPMSGGGGTIPSEPPMTCSTNPTCMFFDEKGKPNCAPMSANNEGQAGDDIIQIKPQSEDSETTR